LSAVVEVPDGDDDDNDDDDDVEMREALAMSLKREHEAEPARPEKRPRLLPPEPNEGAAGAVAVTVRLADGSRVSRRFTATSDTAGDVLEWLQQRQAADSSKHALILAAPPRLKLADTSATLASFGINAPTLLMLTDI